MKIEICDQTSTAICCVAICAAVVLVSLMVFRYNSLAYEKGYTQQQLENSQMVVWVKK